MEMLQPADTKVAMLLRVLLWITNLSFNLIGAFSHLFGEANNELPYSCSIHEGIT